MRTTVTSEVWAVSNTPGEVSFRLRGDTPENAYQHLADAFLSEEVDGQYLDEDALLEELEGRDHIALGAAEVDTETGEVIRMSIGSYTKDRLFS